MNDKIAQIARRILAAGRNIVFTGAGISTESGISDYRSKGGIWDKFRPVYFDEFMSSKASRIEYWRRNYELYPDLVRARPNPGHDAIFRLFQMGLVRTVITQNIDGLHQESGLPNDAVIELHGNARRVRCMHCGKLSSLEAAQARVAAGDTAPECECSGYLKPDTISFGQAMPIEAVQKAASLSRNCDFFMVVGSTLLVQPAALMPQYAKDSNAFLAIVNLSETPYDAVCDVLIKAKAGAVLTEVVNSIKKLQAGNEP
ncbi:MAG: sigma factor regulator FecR [Desulfobacterales bacterium]|nr:sigma factor regulator FecR [Desulfobacterales bacterium]